MESGGVGKRVKNISLSAFTSKNTCSNYFLTQCIKGRLHDREKMARIRQKLERFQ